MSEQEELKLATGKQAVAAVQEVMNLVDMFGGEMMRYLFAQRLLDLVCRKSEGEIISEREVIETAVRLELTAQAILRADSGMSIAAAGELVSEEAIQLRTDMYQMMMRRGS